MSPLELGPPVGLAGANSRRRSQCQRDPRCRRLDFEIAVRVISQLCPGDYPIFVRDLNAQYASIVHGGDTQNLNTTFSCLLVKVARGFSIPPNDSPSHAPGPSLESSPSRLLLIRQEFSNLLRARGEICTYQSTRSEDGKVRYEQGCRRTKASFDDADRDGGWRHGRGPCVLDTAQLCTGEAKEIKQRRGYSLARQALYRSDAVSTRRMRSRNERRPIAANRAMGQASIRSRL